MSGYYENLFAAGMLSGDLPSAVGRAAVKHGALRVDSFARDLHRGLMDHGFTPALDSWSGPAWHAVTSDPYFAGMQEACSRSPALAAQVTADLLGMLPELDAPEPVADPEGWLEQVENDNAPSDIIDAARRAVNDALDAAEQQGEEPDWSRGRAASKARRAARGAMKKAGETVEAYEALSFVAGGGQGQGSGEGGGEGAGQSAARELVRRSSNGRMRRLAELAGRMVRLARALRVEKERGPQEVTGVCLGDDLSQILPNDLALLVDDDTEDLFWSKYIDAGLMQFEREAPEPKGKGPIVFCVDSSGSMEGSEELWSKAVLLGLADVARREGRALAVCHFGGRVMRSTESVDPKSAEALLREVDYFASDYGTEFEPPLRWAADLIETRSEMSAADVVFLTDGKAQPPGPWFAEAKEQLGFRCIGVACGEASSPAAMEAFCDVTIPVSSLTASAGADIASALA